MECGGSPPLSQGGLPPYKKMKVYFQHTGANSLRKAAASRRTPK